MILDRNNQTPQIKAQIEEFDYYKSFGIGKSEFTLPYKKITPFNLVLTLRALHYQKNLKFRGTVKQYLRGAKQLLDTYGPNKSMELLMLSAKLANHPWSFKFVFDVAKSNGVCDSFDKSPVNNLIQAIL